ncbi:MAG: diguanylate cyclase [Planctomycetes bacterium]|nr:diguanylate cyclase [Planctomycetota bacterium]
MQQGRNRNLLIFVGALAMVVLFAGVDYVTGTEVRSVMFYIVPIVLVAWTMPRAWVLLISLLSSMAWTAVLFYTTNFSHPTIAIWNEVAALSIFVMVGMTLATVRRERDRLRRANTRINQLLENEAKISRTDLLTGLPNSREFLERLQPELARSARDGKPMAVMYIDLDNFKKVNDRHGHAAGDAVLRKIADALRNTLRGSDIPARLGGDEFAVLLWQPEQAGAEKAGERVLEAIVTAAQDYSDCKVSASIGIAWFTKPPSTPEETLKIADDAMYEVKDSGKGRVKLLAVMGEQSEPESS